MVKTLIQKEIDGWWPKINSSCTHIVCGSSVVSCLDFRGNVLFSFPGRAPQWLNNETFVYLFSEHPELPNSGYSAVRSFNIRTQESADLFTGDFNMLSAAVNSWAAWRAQDNVIVKNGRTFGYGYGVSLYPPYLTTSSFNEILVFVEDSLYARLRPKGSANVFRVNAKGEIFYGYFTETRKIDLNGNDVDLTISPSGRESVIINVGDWYWSSTEIEDRPYVLGRIGQNKDAIIIPHDGILSDVKYLGGLFYIATNTTRGVLNLLEVPDNEPRKRFSEDSMQAPGVKITYYDTEIKSGKPWKVIWQDRNNPGFGGKVEIVDNSVHVSFSNPIGSDRSGLFRPIKFDALKSREQFAADVRALNDFYASQNGLQRPGGMVVEGSCDVDALITWVYDLMTQDLNVVLDKIRATDEYRNKHNVIHKENWRPSLSEILNWSGDFLDALGNFSRPTFMLPGMPQDLQISVISGYPGTHIPFGWKTYYPKFPQWTFDFTNNLGAFEELIDLCLVYKKIPVIFVPIDAEDSLQAHIHKITPILQRLIDGNRLFCVSWGWEINDINDWTADGDSQLEYLQMLKTLIDVPIYVHFTPERWAGWPSYNGQDQDKSELSWLIEAKRIGITGLLYQEPYDKPVDAIEERAFLLDKKNYLNPGIKGRVETAGLQFVLFEHSRDPEHYRKVVEICKKHNSGWC